jgi:hypothetical protein
MGNTPTPHWGRVLSWDMIAAISDNVPYKSSPLLSSPSIFIVIATNTTLPTIKQAGFSACVAVLHQLHSSRAIV